MPAITRNSEAEPTDRRRSRPRGFGFRAALAVAPVAVVVAGLGGTASAATAPLQPVAVTESTLRAGAATQGIIMRDGGVCDPIRHMGC